jgi:hypothetical protein
LLPNEVKQGWGRVPHGHWIIANSQVNSHDENTAVNVYYQMPFSTAQDKALLLQQVCVPLIRPRPPHSPVSTAPHCAAADCATCCVLGHRQPKVLRDITHGACCAWLPPSLLFRDVLVPQVQQLGYIATCGARRFLSSLGFFALVQVRAQFSRGSRNAMCAVIAA